MNEWKVYRPVQQPDDRRTFPRFYVAPRMFEDANEEADLSQYRYYVHEMTTEDLYDISEHIDVDQYPARADAVRRELGRRRCGRHH
jgi:hypothetical protein